MDHARSADALAAKLTNHGRHHFAHEAQQQRLLLWRDFTVITRASAVCISGIHHILREDAIRRKAEAILAREMSPAPSLQDASPERPPPEDLRTSGNV